MSKLLGYLQGWIGIVGLMALGNTISCFKDHAFLSEKLYTGSPDQVNALMARLFGTWTLLSAILRIYCAVDIKNRTVYNLTLISFVLAFGHFVLECYVYKTAPIGLGVLAPLTVSGASIIAMAMCKHLLDAEPAKDELGNARPTKDIPVKFTKVKSR